MSPGPVSPSFTFVHGSERQVEPRWNVLLVLCGAMFLDALDVSMMGVALPSIRSDLGMTTSSLQWVVSGYVLGYGGFLLLGGRAADLLGRRRMFLISMAVFVVASGLGGLATNGTVLIAARFVTGVSAAFTAPAGLSIITTTFPEGASRNRALALYTATGATGFSLGLVLGGLLTELSWRWVFFVPVLLSLVILVSAIRLVPRSSDDVVQSGSGFDLAGAVTLTAAMLMLVYTVVEAPAAGWASARTIGSFVVTAALLGAFVGIEQRTPSPLVRLGILRSGPLVRANVGAMCLLGGWIGCLFIITLYMQQVRDWSAVATGLAVAPSGIVVAVLAPRIAAPLVGRFGTAPVIAAGLSSNALAYALLLRVHADSSYLVDMLPAFVLVGLGFSLAYGPLNMAATNGIASDEQGLASGLVNASFQIGGALVLATVTAVYEANDDIRVALVVPLLVALVGACVTLWRRRIDVAADKLRQ